MSIIENLENTEWFMEQHVEQHPPYREVMNSFYSNSKFTECLYMSEGIRFLKIEILLYMILSCFFHLVEIKLLLNY